MKKETNADLGLGWEHPGQTRRSYLGLELQGTPGLGPELLGLPWRSKGGEEGDQHPREPWIAASRVHREKRPRNGSSKVLKIKKQCRHDGRTEAHRVVFEFPSTRVSTNLQAVAIHFRHFNSAETMA